MKRGKREDTIILGKDLNFVLFSRGKWVRGECANCRYPNDVSFPRIFKLSQHETQSHYATIDKV